MIDTATGPEQQLPAVFQLLIPRHRSTQPATDSSLLVVLLMTMPATLPWSRLVRTSPTLMSTMLKTALPALVRTAARSQPTSMTEPEEERRRYREALPQPTS